MSKLPWRVSPPPSFDFEEKFIEVLGHRIHYVEAGKGDPVLFVHGNPTSSYAYRNVLRPVASATGRRCIAIDLLGFGHFLTEEDPVRVCEMVAVWINEVGERPGALMRSAGDAQGVEREACATNASTIGGPA